MHDAKGRPLKVGDTVNIPCKIESVSADQGFCNITVKSLAVMPGNGTPNTVTLNTKQVYRANDGDNTEIIVGEENGKPILK